MKSAYFAIGKCRYATQCLLAYSIGRSDNSTLMFCWVSKEVTIDYYYKRPEPGDWLAKYPYACRVFAFRTIQKE